MANRFYKSGWAVTDTVGDIIWRCASVNGTNLYDTFESAGGNNYQVTAGKTFYITRVMFFGNVANVQMEIGYGDTATNNSTAPTNAVDLTKGGFNIEVPGHMNTIDVFYSIPSQKYPYLKNVGNAANNMTAFGFEI